MKDGETAPRRGTFAALAIRDYRHYYTGQGISLIGTWLQAAAVRWLVYEQTGSADRLGLIEAANLMPGLIVGLFAGAISDRVAPKRMILAMQFGQMACAAILAILVASGTVRFWHMVAVLACTRICVSFELPSRYVFLYDLVGAASLTNAIALNSGLFNATRVLGPALVGVGFAALGAAGCFAINAASHLAAIGTVLAIRVDPKPRGDLGRGAALGDVLEGLAYLRRDRAVAGRVALMGFFGVAGMGFDAMMPVFAQTVVGVGVGGYSALLASGGAGATAGALTVARLGDGVDKDRMGALGIVGFSLFLLLAALFPGWTSPKWPAAARLACASGCMFGTWLGASFFYSSTQTMVQMVIPPGLRGRIIGIWMVVFSGSVPLGALWTGRASAVWGVTPVMAASALACLAVGCWQLSTHGRARQGPDADARGLA